MESNLHEQINNAEREKTKLEQDTKKRKKKKKKSWGSGAEFSWKLKL